MAREFYSAKLVIDVANIQKGSLHPLPFSGVEEEVLKIRLNNPFNLGKRDYFCRVVDYFPWSCGTVTLAVAMDWFPEASVAE